MIRILFILGILCVFSNIAVSGQAEYLPKKKYHAFRAEQAPLINGNFDDLVWQNGVWAGGFIQNEPYADRPPSQQTEFKVAFDDMYIYLAIRALDDSPDSITSRMSRRDNGDGDMVFVIFDSYHDLRTGFTFGVSSAGVRFDMIFSNNGHNEDSSWDPNWFAKAQIHDWGWGAEMKIPFTELRFQKNSADVWGFEVARQIFRKNEISLWHPIPRDAPGMIHAMGELDGLEEIEPRKQFDFTPYGVSSMKTYEPEEGNPYETGTDFLYNFGLDGKVGVTNNLTMDFTVNPDFGQVEADPSEVNLTAFETFFEEKRPFFIEGSSITSFNVGLGDGDVGNDNLFYSRRIGRRPHGYPSTDEEDYVKMPMFTPILGAAKLTGKTEKGLSVGVLEATTGETRAAISTNGEKRSEVVEPFTNYALVRFLKDFNNGNTIIGAGLTNTIRKLDDTELDYLHKNASTAGLDFTQYFKDRYYTLSAALYLSNVQGSTDAISSTQLSSARYYQRPDADHLHYDSTLTSLSGLGGKVEFGRIGGKWNFLYMNVFKSPGLELNDMGYMREADNFLNVIWTGYNFSEPFSVFNSININNDFYLSSNFGGQIDGMGYEYNFNLNFKNFWHAHFGGGYNFLSLSNGMLRGGPAIKLPNSGRINYRVVTDDRKIFSAGFFGNNHWNEENFSKNGSYTLNMTIRPFNALMISLNPSLSLAENMLQYVAQEEIGGEDRYLFGHIDQKVLSMSLRINYSVLPDLTIQYWGQPFIASGDFTEFKMITDPSADVLRDRFAVFSDQQLSFAEDIYYVDEDRNGVTDYEFSNPDFTVDEWLSNLVIRWEFKPGSTAFLVWSQTSSYYDPSGRFEVWNSMDHLFTDKKLTSTFLAKLTYRFGRK